MGKLLITEEDRRHILKLYNIVNEAIDPKTGGKIVISNKFDAGYHKLTNKDNVTDKVIYEQIAEQLKPVVDFIKNNPDSIVKIKFISGESNVPNRDNETKPATRVNVGYLSNKRKESMQAYINTFFNDLKEKGIIKSTVEVPPIEYEYIPPKTPWVGQSFCPKGTSEENQRNVCYPAYKKGVDNNDEEFLRLKKQYDDEQRSDLEIEVVRKEPTTTGTTGTTTGTTPSDLLCAAGLKIRVYVLRHKCQNAEFFLYANKTQLFNIRGGNTANLNNAGFSRGLPSASGKKIDAKYLNPAFGFLRNGDESKEGNYGLGSPLKGGNIEGPRSDTFIITDSQSQSIVKDGNGRMDIFLIATTTVAHKDIVYVEITTKKGVTKTYQPKMVQGRILSLTACGDELLETPTDATMPDLGPIRINHLSDRLKLQGGVESSDATDEKSKVLERSQSLIEQMTTLVNLINSKEWRTVKWYYPKDPAYSKNRAKIKEYYNYFQQLIVGDGKPSFKLKEGGYDRSGDVKLDYEDRSMKSDMMGDVKMDLELFYKAYNAIYYDVKTKEYKPEGVIGIWFNLDRLPEWKKMA